MFTVLTNPSFKQVLLGMMRLTLKARFAMVTGLLVLVWLAGCCCLVLFFGLGPCCFAFCRHLLCCQITAFPRWILSDPPLALYTNLRILVMKHHTHVLPFCTWTPVSFEISCSRRFKKKNVRHDAGASIQAVEVVGVGSLWCIHDVLNHHISACKNVFAPNFDFCLLVI